MSDNARYIDDGAGILRFHYGNHGLHALDRAEEVGVEHAAAFVHGHYRNGIKNSVAGIVHPNIDSAEAFPRPRHESVDVSPFSDIARKYHAAIQAANSRLCFLEPGEVAGTHHHASAMREKLAAQSLANPHGRAGDNYDAIAQLHEAGCIRFASNKQYAISNTR